MDEELYKKYLENQDNDSDQILFVSRKNFNRWFIIDSHNINVLRFDFLTCILVLFDCFIVPMKSSFGLEFIEQKT